MSIALNGGPFEPLSIAVGIATAGRPKILSEALKDLSRQERLPDYVFVCPASNEDFDSTSKVSYLFPVDVVKAARGLTVQRNAILDAAHRFDVIVFFDDDFFADPRYLDEVQRCFLQMPDVVGTTGLVIADGAIGPGLSVDMARVLLNERCWDQSADAIRDVHNAYGCNMAFRLEPIRKNKLRFDVNLPLYGWLEDVDFCRQMAAHGRIVFNSQMVGVHLGAKFGRTSGFRLGYSQVANPIYIWRKGSTDFRWAAINIARNVGANLVRGLRPEPWIDRNGRKRGNAKAFWDLMLGRLDPRRVLDEKTLSK